jgi:hypothetical protein
MAIAQIVQIINTLFRAELEERVNLTSAPTLRFKH